MTLPQTTGHREAWDALADAYDDHVSTGNSALAERALALVDLTPGGRLLDVAAGTGALALPAARAGARVLATDWSAPMIERLRARAAAEGLDAAGQVMDAHHLDVADNSYDVVASQFGVMLVPDADQALQEMVRVARPGGRVLLIAFGAPAEFEALQFFLAALRVVLPSFSGPDRPLLEFQFADPQVMRDRLRAAGLTEIVVHPDRAQIEVADGHALWNWCLASNPVAGRLAAALSAAERTDAVAVLDGMVRERADGTGTATLTAAVHLGVGRKAST